MKFDFGSLEREFEADWPVRVAVSQDGGKVAHHEFTVRFRLIPEQELIDFGEGLEQTRAGLDRVIVGFGKRETETWSPEMLDRMCERPAVRVALIKAYAEFVLGAPAKNS